MSNNFKIISFFISFCIMCILCYEVIGYFTPFIIEKRDLEREYNQELLVSSSDYTEDIEKLEIRREELVNEINQQTNQINSMEESMAFLMKEEIFLKVSEAIADTGATFDNFYVTMEGSIKNDYSLQVKGNIYQINKFIENLFVGTPGISIGEFSIRENDDADFLIRFFDDSNALMWYDGSIYKDNYIKEEVESTLDGDDLDELKMKVIKNLPNADTIEYVMTITFRV